MMLLLVSSAIAAPDRVASISAIGTSIPDIVLSEDEEWAAFVDDGASQLYILDTGSWDAAGYEVCASGVSVVGAAFRVDATTELYAACSDGTVGWLSHTSSGGWSIADTSFDLADEENVGIVEADGALYVLGKTDGQLVAHSFEPDTTTIDGLSGYPVTFFYDSITDIAAGALALYVLHSSDNVSKLTLAGGGLTNRETGVGGDGRDLAVINDNALLAGGTSGLLRYNADNNIVILLNSSDMDEIAALAPVDTNTALILADVGQRAFLLYSYDTGTTSVSAELSDSFSYDSEGDPVEMVSMDGYTIAGTDAGELLFLTDRPWVITESFSSGTVAVGDVIDVSFSSDTDGDWEIRNGPDGEVLESGELLADELVSASVTVTDGLLDEGDNELWIAVTDGSSREGHDAVTVSIDNPPGKVSLSAGDIGFGDERIILTFDGVTDSDLSYYEVFLSLDAFTGADDWTFWGRYAADTGLGAGVADIGDPIQHSADAGEAVEITIEGVTNGVTYYLAVRAVDTGGLEGDMSDVFSVIPEETYSASELAGEPGGFCGTPWPASAALALLGGIAAFSRRRRGAAVLAGLLAVSAPMDASADEMPGAKEKAPITARSTSMNVGSVSLTDANLSSAFGSNSLSIWGATAFSLRHIAELEAGFGLIRDSGYTLTSSYASSSEQSKLTVLPLTVSTTLRLDFWENQILVPFASIGGDYWLWRESWAQEFELLSSDAMGGGKYGWHWALGGHLLLDVFEQSQASKLFARSGIRDSYITFEYRDVSVGEWQQTDGGDGLLFDSEVLMFGLRFDR
ncbi:MAG: hypothetical protein P8R54_18535 [Myxococcota bacterium]|nr:hypothetical protein [Myxococcota bacterium]